MAVQIILKNSTTEDKRPKTLANGEISLNYHADGAFLCCQDTEGNIQQVGGVKISTDAPDAPVKQTLWFNPDTLTLFIFDGDAWFPVGGAGGGGGGGGDIIQIIGNDGIDADTIGGIVTLDVELAGGDDGLEFKTSKLSASIASETVLGSVKIGDNIDVSADGTISVDVPQTTTFRGSCILENPPLGQLAPNPPETGDAYINGVATNSIDNGWVNLGGGASAAGDLVIWDGAEWELIQTGGDSLWQRIGTTLEPTVDGDNIATTGKITSASTEDSDSGTTVVTKDYLGTALDNIPDTDNPANQPGTLDDRYVNVIGDNMTGDLTLGTDKITLDASNGNATFAGKATSASTEDTDSDTTLVTKDYLASEIAEGIDDLDAVTEITPGDGIDTRETDGDVTVSVYLAGTNDGLEFETGKLKATVATASELGSVMIGDGVNVDADGTISVPEAPSVTTSDTPPLAADSSNGDLWWNTNDGRLYIYYTDGDSSQWVDASPDSETELITNGPSFPTDAEVNDLFFNTTEGRLYIYFDDGNSQQWVDAAPQGSTGEGGGGGGDVERLVAGDNITLSPADGKGVVTINSTGGPGGVNYNGASAWGSVAVDGTISGSQNIASVVKDAAGKYIVTFTTPMANDNYAVVASGYGAENHTIKTTSRTVNTFNVISNGGDSGFSFAVHSANAIAPPSGVGADAWASVATDGTLNRGYNISSVTLTNTNKYTYTFVTPMPTADYSIVSTAYDAPGKEVVAQVVAQSSTGFDIVTFRDGGNVATPHYVTVHASSTVTPTYTWTRDGTTLSPANAGDAVIGGRSTTTSDTALTLATKDYVDANGGGGTTVNYNGASAWGKYEKNPENLYGFNIGSVNKISDGKYQFNFITPMPNANYAVLATIDNFDSKLAVVTSVTTDSFQIQNFNASGSLDDGFGIINVVVHAENAIAPQSGVGADAWAAFDGDGAIGNTTLDGSFNIASVNKAGEGNYVVTFTTPMPSDNYAVSSSYIASATNKTSTGFTLFTYNTSGSPNDLGDVQFSVHASSTVTPTYTWTRDGTTLKPANDGDGVELDSYLTVADFVTSGERNKADSKGGITINGNAGTIEVYGYYNEKVLQIFDNSDNEKITLERSGSATFTGPVAIGGNAVENTIEEYEQGSWEPFWTGNGATIGTGSYIRVGKVCTCFGNITFPGTNATETQILGGLPFQCIGNYAFGGYSELVSTNKYPGFVFVYSSSQYFSVRSSAAQHVDLLRNDVAGIGTNFVLQYDVA